MSDPQIINDNVQNIENKLKEIALLKDALDLSEGINPDVEAIELLENLINQLHTVKEDVSPTGQVIKDIEKDIKLVENILDKDIKDYNDKDESQCQVSGKEQKQSTDVADSTDLSGFDDF